MATGRRGLCVCFVACLGLSEVEAATLSASVSPSPAVKGATSHHTVRCDFTVATGDTFRLINLYQTVGSSDTLIAILYGGGTVPEWGVSCSGPLRQRGALGGSEGQGFLTLNISDTLCSDQGQSYKCELKWSAGGGSQTDIKTTELTVEAAPKAPTPMVVSPNSENVTEYTNVTFSCTGNVGRPAGTFQWFTFNENDVSSILDVTNQADQGVPQQETAAGESCTFRRTSSLTLNVTRREAGKRLVVRCRVNHPSQGNSNTEACQDPDVDYCQMSQQIDVQYPVSVTVTSDAVTVEEGKDRSITCSTQGNPAPYRIEWRREGENDTLSTGNQLTLSNLTLSDTGNYSCTAYNMIEGRAREASVTVLITVEKTTTPSPTTTTTAATSTLTSKPGPDTSKAGAGDDNTVTIVVVVVVVVVVIAVVIGIVFFMRRRKGRKEVEEPPEKPFNNNAGINTLATRPDLVSNDKSYPDINNSNGYKTEDGLTYAELQFDNKPRSRRPLAIDDSHTDYSDVSMPQV